MELSGNTIPDARFGGANTWDNNRIGRAITDNHRNRFGGNFGGKILPKVLGGETYLFVEYDGMRFPQFRHSHRDCTERSSARRYCSGQALGLSLRHPGRKFEPNDHYRSYRCPRVSW